MIYLDNAATTKPDPEVIYAMMPYLTEKYGNAGSVHSFGISAKNAIENARKSVADMIGASSHQIIFTSSGTESNNLAVLTGKKYMESKRKSIVLTSKEEHNSIRRALETNDCFNLKYSEDSCFGLGLSYVDREKLGFVSIMHTNNETGRENSFENLPRFWHNCGALFHTDCVQAAGYADIDVNKIKCDMMSLSAHKIHGIKGVGALFVKDVGMLRPLIAGGLSQEFGKRGGTENVAGIVAFGKACEIALRDIEQNRKKIDDIRKCFYENLIYEFNRVGIEDRLHANSVIGKIANFRVDGVHGETLVLMCSNSGVCISSGSACDSHDNVASHVLLASGLSERDASSSIRVSFSKFNTRDEVSLAAKKIAECAKKCIDMDMM